MYNTLEYKNTNIATNTTTQVATGKGVLQAITINKTANGAITLADSTTTTTPTIATLGASIAEATYWYNCTFANGLRVVTAAASDITITWAQS